MRPHPWARLVLGSEKCAFERFESSVIRADLPRASVRRYTIALLRSRARRGLLPGFEETKRTGVKRELTIESHAMQRGAFFRQLAFTAAINVRDIAFASEV